MPQIKTQILLCILGEKNSLVIVEKYCIVIWLIPRVWCRVRRFRFKNFFASKRNEIRFACVSHAHAKKYGFFFAYFRFEFFTSNQSEINKPHFRFVSHPKFFSFASFRFRFFRFAPKRNEINVFSLCFTSKRNELNIFSSLPFTSLGVDLKNWKTDRNIFLRFFTDCPKISLYPFSLWSFRFFFVFFASFNFHTLFMHRSEKKFASVSLHFASNRKWRRFRFFFVSFSLCFIFVSLQISTFRIDAKQAKKTLFFALKQKKFRFRFASFHFEAKMTVHSSMVS